MIVLIASLLMIIIIEIGINFISIEKAQSDYTIDHKLTHKKTSEGIGLHEKENLDLLRSWYQGTFLAEAGLLGLYYGCFFWNLYEFKTYQLRTENIVLSTVRMRQYAMGEKP